MRNEQANSFRTRVLACALILLACLLCRPAPVHAKWGDDINAGAGPRLIDRIRTGLKNVLDTPEDRREEVIARFVDVHAEPHTESLKRFRNPEFKALFVRMLNHASWKIKHRALFALEYYRDPGVLKHVWPFLEDKEARLREKAAITTIKLWGKGAPKPPKSIESLLEVEKDLHVRSCLHALQARMSGKLYVERVYDEVLIDLDGGLKITPFVSGLASAKSSVPSYKANVQSRSGGGSATKLPATSRWTTPLLGYGDEEVKGASLQPFANLRGGGKTYHTGQDVGASLDGAGYYAPADGIVRLIHTGSDMGTLIVVEHHLGDKGLVNGVYMHGGDTVFVKAGDKVTCGQLLGTMGMSFSIENGGHYSHLHYGMYPGPFSMTHNYGYKPVKAGLADWYDPAKFLPLWIERTAPLINEFLGAPKELAGIAKLIREGAHGKAYALLHLSMDSLNGDSAKRVGEAMRIALELVPTAAMSRATTLRGKGYPKEALRVLVDVGARAKGIPGIGSLTETSSTWKKDKAFKAELKAEKAFKKAVKSAAEQKDAKKRDAIWSKALKASTGTPVEQRVKEKMK